MTSRRIGMAALLGLSSLVSLRPARAAEPPRLALPAASANQQLADAIAHHLRQSASLRRYSVDVAVRGGQVEVTGSVADQPQREEVLRLVQGVPGVERVLDRLRVSGAGSTVLRAQAEAPALPPGKLPDPLPPPGANGGPNGPIPEPAAVFRAPMPGPYGIAPPNMPPYAWPTYAPYNNYSRVAYPQAYPYNAWPFIGPVYPFPKIPLGWRSVKLEWDDGHWYYGRVGHKFDWWKIRYW